MFISCFQSILLVWISIPEKSCFYANSTEGGRIYVRFNMHEPKINQQDFNELMRHYRMVISDPDGKNIDGREVSGHSHFEVQTKKKGQYRLCSTYFEYNDQGNRLDQYIYRIDLEFENVLSVQSKDKLRTPLSQVAYSLIISDMIEKAQQGKDWHRQQSEFELKNLVATQKFVAILGILLYLVLSVWSQYSIHSYLKRLKI